MARLSGVSTDSFSASARGRRLSVASVIGLGSILRDQKSLSTTQANIVGTTARIVTDPVSKFHVSSSPMEPNNLLDADNNSISLKKEDIWPNIDIRSTSGTMNSHCVMDKLSLIHNHGRIGCYQDAGFVHENGYSHTENLHPRSGYNSDLLKTSSVTDTVSNNNVRNGGLATALKNLGSVSSTPLYRESDKGEPIPISASKRCQPMSRRKPGSRKSTAEDLGHYTVHQSAPVNVPDWSKILKNEVKELQKRKGNKCNDYENEEDDQEEEEGIPPHELIARERARSETITFSVCEGQGRTLKGRDMSRMRNAVWKQIGLAD